MKLSASARKRRQRDRAKRGGGVLRLEVPDLEAWCQTLVELGLLDQPDATPAQIAAATTKFVGIHCENYRRNQTLELLGADGPDDRPEVESSIYEDIAAGIGIVEMSDIELDKM